MIKSLNTFTDDRGSLTVVETLKDIPFEVKRIYWIYNVPKEKERGCHANRITYQYLVAVKGTININLIYQQTFIHYHLNVLHIVQ